MPRHLVGIFRRTTLVLDAILILGARQVRHTLAYHSPLPSTEWCHAHTVARSGPFVLSSSVFVRRRTEKFQKFCTAIHMIFLCANWEQHGSAFHSRGWHRTPHTRHPVDVCCSSSSSPSPLSLTLMSFSLLPFPAPRWSVPNSVKSPKKVPLRTNLRFLANQRRRSYILGVREPKSKPCESRELHFAWTASAWCGSSLAGTSTCFAARTNTNYWDKWGKPFRNRQDCLV